MASCRRWWANTKPALWQPLVLKSIISLPLNVCGLMALWWLFSPPCCLLCCTCWPPDSLVSWSAFPRWPCPVLLCWSVWFSTWSPGKLTGALCLSRAFFCLGFNLSCCAFRTDELLEFTLFGKLTLIETRSEELTPDGAWRVTFRPCETWGFSSIPLLSDCASVLAAAPLDFPWKK